MGNLSLYKYRPGVKDGYAVIALFGIFVWTTLGVNTGVVASEFDVILPSESYQSNQQHRPYKVRRAAQDPNADSEDIPTVTGDNCGDIRTQATELFKAIDGVSDHRQTVVNILSKCTREQRQKIADAYTEIHYKDLVVTMENKYSDAYFNLLTKSLTDPLPKFLADYLFDALYNVKYYRIKYCSTPLVNDSTTADMHQFFVKRNGGTIAEGTTSEPFTSKLSKVFWNIVKSEYNGVRSSINDVDKDAACTDAGKIIGNAKSHKLLELDSDFHRILTTTSFPQLRLVDECFKDFSSKSLQQTLKSLLYPQKPNAWKKGPVNACTNVLQYAEDKAKFFARGLRDAVLDWGTDDELLIFIIAWRADIDLGNIKKAYEKLDGTSLYDDVAGDTSDEYRDLLLALIGK